MTVILKDRTFMDREGRAVPEGHLDAAFLVGPRGARITDAQAKSLGLENGHVVDTRPENPKHKELKKPQNKEHQPDGDKGHDAGGEPSPANKKQERVELIQGVIRGMMDESNESQESYDRLFTQSGLPDANVISSRIGSTVKAPERDAIWKGMQK